MERFKIIIYFVLLSVFFFLFDYATLHASVIEDKRLSFDFTNCDISEALRQITKASGIKIIANGHINKRIADKSYKNMTLDRILSDLLRGQNCAIVWHYNESGLSSINIRNFGQSGSVSTPIVTASRGGVEPNIAVPGAVQSRSNIQSANIVRVPNTGRSSGLNNNLNSSNRSGTVRNNVVSSIISNNQGAIIGQTHSVSPGRISGNRNAGFTSNTARNRESAGDTGKNAESSGNTIKKDENSTSTQITPIPEKWDYLEAPPMPPGFSNNVK